MFGIQHIDCARRIHHGPQETLKFGTAVSPSPATRQAVSDT
jgi:hypothetical protein